MHGSIRIAVLVVSLVFAAPADAARGKDAVAQAKAELATGKYEQAQKRLEKRIRARRGDLEARVWLARAYRMTGKESLARQILETFYDDWSAGEIDRDDPRALMYVGMAMQLLGNFEDANETLRDAVAANPRLHEANIAWGNMFLEKYAAGHAQQSFEEVLSADPDNADALVGMARVVLEQRYDVVKAAEYVDKALAASPGHAKALLVRAGLEVDDREFERAKKTLQAILKANPRHLDALSTRAAIAWLEDDAKELAATEKKVLTIHPKYAPFYHQVAEYAVKAHRYEEAIALENKALALDPDYYLAAAAVGMNHLRLGQEEKGLEKMNAAFEHDPYNVRAYNILNLFEKVIPKGYEFITGKHVRLRVRTHEKPVLARYVPRFLDEAYAGMQRRYGFTPGQVTLELFDNPDHYGVRTVGLPNLGALGICFGNVITSLSPSGGNLNWGMVLWHELAHSFALGLSKHRVPRWFTEGLSEYETVMQRPEWRRENDHDVYKVLAAGNLPSVTELDRRFTRAKDMEEMVVAYHLSSLAVEFMATRWGFPSIVRALKMYGDRKDTPEVMKQVTGLDVAAFDSAFREWLGKRLAHYAGGTADGYEPTLKLAQAALSGGDSKKAVQLLEKATLLDPERSEPHAVLAELHEAAGNMKAAVEARTRYAMLEQMEYAPLSKLVTYHHGEKNWQRVRELGESALLIYPFDAELHLHLGDAYLALAQPADALYEYDSALLVTEQPLRRPALAHLGRARALLASNKRRPAAAALKQALTLEPKNPDARSLRRQLK